SVHQSRGFGCKHAGLVTAVGMTAQPYPPWLGLTTREDFRAKTPPITRRRAWPRRTMRPLLAKWQIIAKDEHARLTESISQGYQQRGIAIRTRAMHEDQGFHASPLQREEGTNRKGPPD